MNLTDEELMSIPPMHSNGGQLAHDRAVIRAHMDKLIAECGVEPVATIEFDKIGWRSFVDSIYGIPDGTKLYTADQLAAAVAKNQAENGKAVNNIMLMHGDLMASRDQRIDQLLARVVELEAQLDGMKGTA